MAIGFSSAKLPASSITAEQTHQSQNSVIKDKYLNNESISDEEKKFTRLPNR